MFGKKRKPKLYQHMTTKELLNSFIISKLPRGKERLSNEQSLLQMHPPENINYVAIVLDGVVEDVMRCQDRLAALILSNPQFVEFDPEKDRPQIGLTKYENGKFVPLLGEENES